VEKSKNRRKKGGSTLCFGMETRSPSGSPLEEGRIQCGVRGNKKEKKADLRTEEKGASGKESQSRRDVYKRSEGEKGEGLNPEIDRRD